MVAISNVAESSTSTNGALTVAGGLGVAKDINVGDDLSLLSDAAVLNFGANRDVKLTHRHNKGLQLNSNMQLQFRNSGSYISSDAAGQLQARANTQINLNIAGTDELSLTSNTATFGTNIVIPDGANIGSASDQDAISISATGVVAVSNTTESSASNNGARTVAGGLGVAKDLNVGDDLSLLSNSAVLNFGVNRDVTLTHSPGVGLDCNLRIKATSFHASSDETLKKNIEKISNVDKILDAVDGVQYNWKKGNDTQEYGVIAQKVQEVMPDSVAQDSNNHLSVNYNHIVGVLVAAVKEQRSRITDLENRLSN